MERSVAFYLGPDPELEGEGLLEIMKRLSGGEITYYERGPAPYTGMDWESMNKNFYDRFDTNQPTFERLFKTKLRLEPHLLIKPDREDWTEYTWQNIGPLQIPEELKPHVGEVVLHVMETFP